MIAVVLPFLLFSPVIDLIYVAEYFVLFANLLKNKEQLAIVSLQLSFM